MVGRKIFFEVNVFSFFFDFMMVEPRPGGRLIRNECVIKQSG